MKIFLTIISHLCACALNLVCAGQFYHNEMYQLDGMATSTTMEVTASSFHCHILIEKEALTNLRINNYNLLNKLMVALALSSDHFLLRL